MRGAESKIVTRAALRALLVEHQPHRRKIALANGRFDTLHVRHPRYLQGARREGGILSVAVNSDSSVCKLKGPGRPILPETARAALVGALRAVDYIVVFSEDNVEALLAELRPDVHAKGTDYTAENVPERATSDRLGIRVAIVGDAKNHSTREFIDLVRKVPHA